MKEVKGYITTNGEFFQDRNVAQLREAEHQLIDCLRMFTKRVNLPTEDLVINFIRTYPTAVKRYSLCVEGIMSKEMEDVKLVNEDQQDQSNEVKLELRRLQHPEVVKGYGRQSTRTNPHQSETATEVDSSRNSRDSTRQTDKLQPHTSNEDGGDKGNPTGLEGKGTSAEV